MSKFQVDKNLFSKYVNLLNLKGELENKELLVGINNDNITARAVSASKILCVRGILKGKFADWGDIGIDNLTMFKNIINSITQTNLDISKTENKIMLSGNKVKYSGVLRNPKYIVNSVDGEKFENLKKNCEGNTFTLKSEDIKQIINYTNAISPSFLTFDCVDNVLKVVLVNENNEAEIEFTLTNTENFTCKLSKVFVDILQALSEYDIQLSMKTDTPVLITVSNKDMCFEYIFAPMKK